MLWCGMIRAVRQGRGVWRCYFHDGSCWLLRPEDGWFCLWGAVFGPDATEAQRVREEGLRVSHA